jgi:hypothetical protein
MAGPRSFLLFMAVLDMAWWVFVMLLWFTLPSVAPADAHLQEIAAWFWWSSAHFGLGLFFLVWFCAGGGVPLALAVLSTLLVVAAVVFDMYVFFGLRVPSLVVCLPGLACSTIELLFFLMHLVLTIIVWLDLAAFLGAVFAWNRTVTVVASASAAAAANSGYTSTKTNGENEYNTVVLTPPQPNIYQSTDDGLSGRNTTALARLRTTAATTNAGMRGQLDFDGVLLPEMRKNK